MRNLIDEYIHPERLTLFSSGTCNLHCEYCFLNKIDAHKQFNQETTKAIVNGDYLKNIISVCEKLHVDKNKITKIDFWGGEPYINERFLDIIPHLCDEFPNINEWGTSTNFMLTSNIYNEYVKIINDSAKTKSSIVFQTSIDGPEGTLTDHGHHGNWSTYKTNFEKFAHFLNNTRLDNIESVEIVVKPTIDNNLFINYFNNYENISKYIDYMIETYEFLYNTFANKFIHITVATPTPSYPFLYTKEMAIQLTDCIKKWEAVAIKKHAQAKYFKDYWSSLLNGFGSLNSNHSLFKFDFGCHPMTSSLMIAYDGTVVDCTSNFIYGRDSYIEECLKTNNLEEYEKSKLYKKFVFNPLRMTEDEIEDFIWAYIAPIQDGGTLMHCTTMKLIDELSLSGILPYKYHEDAMLRLRASTFMNSYISCLKDHIGGTHVPMVHTIGASVFALTDLMSMVNDMQMNKEE